MGLFSTIGIVEGKKKMVVNLRKDVFITALIITIALFLLGFYFARIWDNFRIEQVDQEIRDSTLDTMGILIEQEFLNQFNISSCEFSENRLAGISKNLFELGQKLAEYEKKGLLNKKEYEDLRREYFLIEARAYTQFIEFIDKCDSNLNVILFFYNVDQDVSERQGYVLDAVVERQDKKIRVFSIDSAFSDQTLETIKSFYNITSIPTLIINNNLKKEGFISTVELVSLVK